jgi:hypothetical protein
MPVGENLNNPHPSTDSKWRYRPVLNLHLISLEFQFGSGIPPYKILLQDEESYLND